MSNPHNNDPQPQVLKTDAEPDHKPDIYPLHRQVIREMEEPHDGFAPTPVWLMFIYFALLMWGGYYLATYAGDFSPDIFTDGPLTVASAGTDVAPKVVDPMVLGKRVYNNCIQCHQPDGNGVPGAFPPLNGNERIAGEPHVLAAILLHGLKGPIHVKGESFNGEMPSWSQLSDAEIAGVLTYVRSSWGQSYEAVPTELVTAVRAATSDRSGPYSDAALDALAKQPAPELAKH